MGKIILDEADALVLIFMLELDLLLELLFSFIFSGLISKEGEFASLLISCVCLSAFFVLPSGAQTPQ